MSSQAQKNWYREIKNWFKTPEDEIPQDIEVAGHLYKGLIKVGSAPLVLNGAGVRTIDGKPIYAVGLYLPHYANRSDTVNALIGPRRIELVILEPLDASGFVESLRTGIHDNTNETAREFIRNELCELEEVMSELTNMSPYDQVEFDWIPKKGTFITYNDEVLGTPIPGKALNDAVVNIWIGDKTLDAPLRDALLAGKPKTGKGEA